MGYRYRLHRKDLPGKADLVFPGRRKVIFVHGCFWRLGVSQAVVKRGGWRSAYFSQPILEGDRSLFSPVPSPPVPRQWAQSANSLGKWRARQDSNLRPSASKATGLPGPNSGRGLGNRLSMAVIFCVPRTVHTPRVSFEKRRDRPALGHFGDDRSGCASTTLTFHDPTSPRRCDLRPRKRLTCCDLFRLKARVRDET